MTFKFSNPITKFVYVWSWECSDFNYEARKKNFGSHPLCLLCVLGDGLPKFIFFLPFLHCLNNHYLTYIVQNTQTHWHIVKNVKLAMPKYISKAVACLVEEFSFFSLQFSHFANRKKKCFCTSLCCVGWFTPEKSLHVLYWKLCHHFK